MTTIDIIAASAGTGKTYTLCSVLEDSVVNKRARPDCLIATTFTLKAAAELRERLSTRLLSKGLADDARRLAGARVGTVNAICTQLITDFALELGLPPRLQVLDDPAAAHALAAAMSHAIKPELARQLADLSHQLTVEWQDHCRSIVHLARTNNIGHAALTGNAERSISEFVALLPDEADGTTIEGELAAAITDFDVQVDLTSDRTQKTRNAHNTATRFARALASNTPPPWKDWIKLARLSAAKASNGLLDDIRRLAAQHACHPRFRQDICDLIRLVFDAAAATLEAYESHKRERGALDFLDQEIQALKLLEQPELAAWLRTQLDLVVVDEFQDTNPLQLAVFLKLAELAQRSVWVGDQKQAIYGFRDTDPALMDACIEYVLEGGRPTTLTQSFRSRPALVALTSALFVPAFARHNIPEDRVHIESAVSCDDHALGPIVEHWYWRKKNKDYDAQSLAAGVHHLLEDLNARVRDLHSEVLRRPRPQDIAVLCRTNNGCAAIAAALHDLGLPAVIPEGNVLSTPEAVAALNGLRLWADPRDRLAAAHIARGLAYLDNPDEWLACILNTDPASGLDDVPLVSALRAAQAANPELGVVAAFDAVLEALDLREMCIGWGHTASRLANLDALRAHAVRYVQDHAARGQAATVVGFLQDLSPNLQQAQLTDQDAVFVCTWHGAKGLEWPVTVLYELHDREDSPYGVDIASDRTSIDPTDPLGGRWIRFWPNPYHDQNRDTPLDRPLADSPLVQAARQKKEAEDLRLLYVLWTRARDRVILPARKDKLLDGYLQSLRDDSGCLVSEPAGDEATWAGVTFSVHSRALRPIDSISEPTATTETWYTARGPQEHPPAFLSPSTISEPAADSTAPADTLITIGERIPLTGTPHMDHLGSALHGFLAADRPELDDGLRLEIAQRLVGNWGLSDVIAPQDMLSASDHLRRWIDAEWPDAVWHREWPIYHRLRNGTTVNGQIDLLLETPAGHVIIDHKSFPGTEADAIDRARGHRAQLEQYAAGIEAATGRRTVGKWIHLPVLGKLVGET